MTEKQQLKIAIVGADKRRWLPAQAKFAQAVIEQILNAAKTSHLLSNGDMRVENFDSTKSLNVGTYTEIPADTEIIAVSGHCPIGVERWYNVTRDCWEDRMDIWQKINPYTQSQRGTVVEFNNEKFVYVYDEGGVDTWLEIIAARLGIKMEIHTAPAMQWEDKIQSTPQPDSPFRKVTKLNGFETRNMNIAQSCTVLFDIEPIIASGTLFSAEIYKRLLAKYNHYGKPKFELELITKCSEPDLCGNKIDAISGIPTKVEKDANGKTWLYFDDGYAREIDTIVNEWAAVYTSGGYYALQQALKLKKSKSRMVPIA